MLVSEYVMQVIDNRQYKYATKQSYIKGIKSLGIWDLTVDSLSPQFFYQKLDTYTNLNTRKMLSIICKSVFKDLGICKDIRFQQGIPRTYDLPSQDALHASIERTKYKHYLYLCMHAGVRVGEACAITPQSVIKNGYTYYLQVDKGWSQDGLNLGSAKTIGNVMIPEWLAKHVLQMTEDQIWKKGQPTQLISWACGRLSTRGEKVHINPHMLRHWFATDMARRNVPVHVIMRQMRHKNINTTMAIYAQVHSNDLADALPTRPEDKVVPMAKVIQLRSVN